MKKRLKAVFEMLGGVRTGGSFIQNSAWMFSSSGISILIQTAFFVILARIYPPEVYGLFGIFNVYLGVLGNAATLGYNQAFVLPESDQKFSRLLQLTIWVSLAVCGLAELFFLAVGDGMLAMFHHNELARWLYAVPPIALLMALDRVVCDWAIRNKEFRQQMLWSTSTTLFAKGFNVFYGLRIAPTVAGLVVTTALQYLLRIVAYSRFALVDFSERLRQVATWQELKTTAREYIDYPKYVHWGNVIN
ncbi:MAG: lipopolysaccharide biosynthesis protein, partial [Flavobacteriales bacterium]